MTSTPVNPADRADLAEPSGLNAQRARRTRARLLVAAVDTLIEHGYSATTVAAVQQRAGASRGAMLHHYPTKSSLLLEAVEFLADAQLRDLDQRAEQLQATETPEPEQRLATWLDLMWTSFASPLFIAVMELWVAARTDPELHTKLIPHERRLGSRLRALAQDIVGVTVPGDELITVVEMTMVYYRGLALSGLVDLKDRDRRMLLTAWSDLLISSL